MDLWGLCDSCQRWFYCPTPSQDDPGRVRLDGSSADPPGWSCPVCGEEPTRIENRQAARRASES